MKIIKLVMILTTFFIWNQSNAQIKPIKSVGRVKDNKTIIQNSSVNVIKINTDDLTSENYVLNSALLQSIFGKNITKGYELQIEHVEAIKEQKPMLQLSYFSNETNGQEIITATLALDGDKVFISETPIKTSILDGVTTKGKLSREIVKQHQYIGHVTLLK
jgi:hypothetical protein